MLEMEGDTIEDPVVGSNEPGPYRVKNWEGRIAVVLSCE